MTKEKKSALFDLNSSTFLAHSLIKKKIVYIENYENLIPEPSFPSPLLRQKPDPKYIFSIDCFF
ncbi:hypothetical protein A7Q10_04775 [Methylacidiphilum caldifontis]|uniref:Uncharacterized protein n=1 Tax=Methylacidiphilum caldifontis TaxID=2795386 RepID=A0A4Y8PGX6_9BACT|nr:hypothetical protein A7Q10_04775 [Methylacidiphilum caldifontis]